jgi:hypothetical protein
MRKRIPVFRKDQKLKRLSDYHEWVKCSKCGIQQSDMGANVSCEECGFWPMPSPSADLARIAREQK